MYDERNKFSIRNLVLQILLIILFVFIMIWLFPTKGYIKDKYVTKDQLIEQLQSIYGRNFADNVESMRDAAKDYFTKERLPEKLGDSVTLTLGEMLNKKLVLEFTDSNGQKCDTKESYVRLTKMDSEYQLKVQLTCSDYSDYIIDYIGCYNYCDNCNNTVVVKPNNKPTNNTPSNDKPNNNQPTTPEEPNDKPNNVVSKKYKYQYRLTTQNTYSKWTDWSNWSKNKVSANLLTQVEIEKRQELDGYTKDYKIIGYNKETYTDYENQTYTDYVTETYIAYENQKYTEYVTETYTDYETRTYTDYETTTGTVASGTKRVLVDSRNASKSEGYYGDWYSAGSKTVTDTFLSGSDTESYTLENEHSYLDCSNGCKYHTDRTYSVQRRDYHEGSSSCPSGYDLEGDKCNKYSTETTYEQVTNKKPVTKTEIVPVTKTRQVPVTKVRQVPVTKTRQVPVTKIKQVAVTKTKDVPVYGYTNGDPIYKTVNYYRYRTRTQETYATVDYKWSESNNDSTLLSQGYVLTGYYEEV